MSKRQQLYSTHKVLPLCVNTDTRDEPPKSALNKIKTLAAAVSSFSRRRVVSEIGGGMEIILLANWQDRNVFILLNEGRPRGILTSVADAIV